ncbi:hypothetical protein XAP6164_4780002 [Xanthomonas phaseoli pv. phaseoli]|nr:hypothetical protein XAP6164_4780002 [Xanthomonas phaseoli pv. phaseoli]
MICRVIGVVGWRGVDLVRRWSGLRFGFNVLAADHDAIGGEQPWLGSLAAGTPPDVMG